MGTINGHRQCTYPLSRLLFLPPTPSSQQSHLHTDHPIRNPLHPFHQPPSSVPKPIQLQIPQKKREKKENGLHRLQTPDLQIPNLPPRHLPPKRPSPPLPSPKPSQHPSLPTKSQVSHPKTSPPETPPPETPPPSTSPKTPPQTPTTTTPHPSETPAPCSPSDEL